MKTNKISVTVYEKRTIEIAPVYPVCFAEINAHSTTYYRYSSPSHYVIVCPLLNAVYTSLIITPVTYAYDNFKQIDQEEFVMAMRKTVEDTDVIINKIEAEYEQETLPEDVKRQQLIEAREQDMCDQQQDN